MGQLSLFPETSELRDRALDALERLEIEVALDRLRRARAADPDLFALDEIEPGIRWLAPFVASAEPVEDGLADAFLAIPAACRDGRLRRASARFLDEAIARCALRRSDAEFLDSAECLHRGALLLVRDQADAAREGLRATLAAEHRDRADLWFWLADACQALGLDEEARPSYVRALVLGARRCDLSRTVHTGLAELLDRLCAEHPEPCARERLLSEAWLARLLPIPRANGWLDEAPLRSELESDPHLPEDRLRHFALRLYLDLSRPGGTSDLAERERMKELAPDLFAPFIQALRQGELHVSAAQGARR